jgi:proteasome accessory factor C
VSEFSDKVRRLLALVPYVLKHPGVTLGELCEVFDVSQEELLEDLGLIVLCGRPDYTPADLIEAEIDDDRVYIRMADYFARPLRFTPSELAGLYLACSAMAGLAGPAASTALRSAMGKIEKALGTKPDAARDIEGSVEISVLSPEREILAGLAGAVEERRVVDMEYYSYGRGDLTRRRVHPLSLEFGMGHWYLHAWDERSGETRVFRVDRVKSLHLTGETFEPPRGNGGGEVPPSPLRAVESGRIKARLRLSSTLARWAREQPIFTELEEDEEGVVVTLRTDSLSWLEREILTYGPAVEVIHPPELKEGLRRRIRGLLEKYRVEPSVAEEEGRARRRGGGRGG